MIKTIEEIDALLAVSNKQLIKIGAQYLTVARAETQNYEYIIEIKNLIENLRSVLDYIATSLHSIYGKNNSYKPYFPYARIGVTKFGFEKNFFKKYVKTATTDTIFNIIKSYQYFNTKDKWLNDLMEISNKLKHVTLNVSGKAKEKIGTIVTSSTGSTNMNGNLEVINRNGRLGFYGAGSVNSSDRIAIYADNDNTFTINFGKDSMTIDKNNNLELDNIIITDKESHKIKFYDGDNIIVELKKMYEGVGLIYNSLKSYL